MAESDSDVELRRLLVGLAAAMVASGQPVYEVEEDVATLARRLGHPQTQVAAAPTGVSLALAPGESATFEGVHGPLRLDQTGAVRYIRHRLLSGELDLSTALRELEGLPQRPRRYPRWAEFVGWVGGSTGIALILQPDPVAIGLTALASAGVYGLTRLATRVRLVATLLPSIAALLVALLTFAAADAGLLAGPLRTLLAPLAILLPGAQLVTGMSELAAGAMVAGGSRVGYGAVQLLLFALGIVAAGGLLRVDPEVLANVRVAELGWWSIPVGLLVIIGGISLMESVRPGLMPLVAIVVLVTFSAQLGGQTLGGAALGGFLGAIAATVGATLVETVRPQLARLVLFLPAFWLLVPGSLGLLSVTEVAIGPGGATNSAVAVIELIASLAVGLLVGGAMARAVRAAVRRTRAARARGGLSVSPSPRRPAPRPDRSSPR